MGLTMLVLIAVLILSIIGLGWQTFVLGAFKGGEKIINSTPEIKNVSQKVKQYIVNIIEKTSEDLINNGTVSNQSYSTTFQSEEDEQESKKENPYKIEIVRYNLYIYLKPIWSIK
jgi:uncharacterized membrane protein